MVNRDVYFFMLVGAFFCSTFTSQSQIEKQLPQFQRAIYAETINYEAYYSVNLDMSIRKASGLNWGVKLGISVLADVLAIPVGVNSFFGKRASKVELSLNLVPLTVLYDNRDINIKTTDSYIFVMPALGYRYQKQNGGFFLRSTVSPTVKLDPPSNDFWAMTSEFKLIGTLGVGYSF